MKIKETFEQGKGILGLIPVFSVLRFFARIRTKNFRKNGYPMPTNT